MSDDCHGIPNPVCEITLQHLTKLVDEIHRALVGNGKPGLIIEVERLKQVAESRQFWERKVGAAVIGSVVTALGSGALALWGIVHSLHNP